MYMYANNRSSPRASGRDNWALTLVLYRRASESTNTHQKRQNHVFLQSVYSSLCIQYTPLFSRTDLCSLSKMNGHYLLIAGLNKVIIIQCNSGKRNSFSYLCLFILHVSISVPFLFLLVSGIDCGVCFWHSLDVPINCFVKGSRNTQAGEFYILDMK